MTKTKVIFSFFWSVVNSNCVFDLSFLSSAARGSSNNNNFGFFIKHLPSREKVHQLLSLFGCEYREGRAAAAPLLRPIGSDGREGGHSADDCVSVHLNVFVQIVLVLMCPGTCSVCVVFVLCFPCLTTPTQVRSTPKTNTLQKLC